MIETQQPAAIEFVHVSKRFGMVQANSDINLLIRQGSIHGIVGENGAGKSTLMNILYGYYQADSGDIKLLGKNVHIENSQQAIALGIGMVHQHFMLVEKFTVMENIILGSEKTWRNKTAMQNARSILDNLSQKYGMSINPEALIENLPVGLQQRVEILKALYRGAEILILDEPTSVLTPQEVQHFFSILRTLRDAGKTVVLITHKLHEIMAVTDHVTVMRQGKIIDTILTATTSKEQLAEMMVGRRLTTHWQRQKTHQPAPLLEVKKLSLFGPDKRPILDNINLTVNRGEILGVAGVSGNGQSQLLEVLSGMRSYHEGEILLGGRQLKKLLSRHRPTQSARQLLVSHIPEDRLGVGLVKNFKAWESGILGYHYKPPLSKAGFIKKKNSLNHFATIAQDYDVRPPNAFLKTSSFSGGNQQKLVIGRELEENPDLLLIGQPTRGVDVGAIEFIHRRLIELRDAGKALLLVSAELDEILTLADRIVVMFDGKIVGVLPRHQASETKIGLLMAGVVEEIRETLSEAGIDH
ncbi:MAG: ABC transporter ATP-binding protein [Alphaproteobacteria bacterium]|nr:ABC transporter ATP-binding protein [Alphaproteobacteria bacterium]